MVDMVVAIDTETELIKPGSLAPRMVCLSYCYETQYAEEGYRVGIVHAKDAKPTIEIWLKGAIAGNVRIVGHNLAYDTAVIASEYPELTHLIFEAYEKSGFDDTLIREQLIDINAGTFWVNRKKKGWYTLLGLAERHMPYVSMSKGADTYRLRYGELIDEPLKYWPKEAVAYAEKDALVTLGVYMQQTQAPIADEEKQLRDSKRQTRADFVLHLMSCWGVVTDPEKTEQFTKEIEDSMKKNSKRLMEYGLMRDNGTKDTREINKRIQTKTKNPKTTAKGNISIGEEALLGSGLPDLKLLVDFTKAQKLDSVWKRYLLQGSNRNTPVQARFHCLVESGRTSCSNPNLQNPHRATGLRECFVPREGSLFIACDYSTLELCTLAQVNLWLFKKSSMADKLNEGVDLHLHFASQMLGISYDESLTRLQERDPEVRETRQVAKAANFGYPGGMGANSFRAFAKGYGVEITEKEAHRLREDWFRAWPEMREYFNFVQSTIGGEVGTIEHFISKRGRGGVRFTQACNSYFQGLAADGAKEALFAVSQECYTDPESPLYRSRPVMFIHDEIILESPSKKAPYAAERLAHLMRKAMQKWTPDIPIKTSIALMDRWYKNAEEVRDDFGRLVPWKP